MHINQKELHLPRKIKVQQAAETAATLLHMEGYEVTKLQLCNDWMNWYGVFDCDVSALVIEMIVCHKEVVEQVELLEDSYGNG